MGINQFYMVYTEWGKSKIYRLAKIFLVRLKLFSVPPKLYIGVTYINIQPTITDFQSHIFIYVETETNFSPTKINFSVA